MSKIVIRNAATGVCLALLAVLAGARLYGPVRPPASSGAIGEAEHYHWRVRQAAETAPLHIGRWTGQDVQVQPAARNLTRPNFILCRRYVHDQTGVTANLLVVQARSAADMAGHYPTNYYPANGWSLAATDPHTWQVRNLTIRGTRFVFSRMMGEQIFEQVIDQFMVLPNGRIVRTLEQLAPDPIAQTIGPYGAAQFHLVTDAALSEDEREKAFVDLMSAYLPVIQAIRSGATR